MGKRDTFSKVLAVVGVLLSWFPLLAPILLTLIFYASSGRFRFDYLMPAELFPAALLGGGLLFWTALRMHRQRRTIGYGLAAALILLVGGQLLAVLTGLASGETPPGGWAWALVLASLAAYSLSLLVVAIAGLQLLRHLFTPPIRQA